MNFPRDIDQADGASPKDGDKGGYTRVPNGSSFWRPSKQALAGDKTRAFREHWRSLCAGQPMPPRHALDPIDIPALLPHLVLVDVMREPLQFRYRLIGTFVTGLAERDSTGRFLDRALYGDALEAMIWPYLQIIEKSTPTATLSGVLFAERDWHSVENLFVPFGEEGLIEMIAVCVEVDRNGVKSGVNHGLILDWDG
jgi:hypothetical protein